MVIRLADGRVAALDYREMAPLAATRDMYIGANLRGESIVAGNDRVPRKGGARPCRVAPRGRKPRGNPRGDCRHLFRAIERQRRAQCGESGSYYARDNDSAFQGDSGSAMLNSIGIAQSRQLSANGVRAESHAQRDPQRRHAVRIARAVRQALSLV